MQCVLLPDSEEKSSDISDENSTSDNKNCREIHMRKEKTSYISD